jgi:KaiC/GvpD/RAD55 family RecA-like ATPase
VAQSNKYSTGIPGLDLTLDGGFPSGTRIVIYGAPLSGLEMLAEQFWRSEEKTGAYLMLDAATKADMEDARGLDPAALVKAMEGTRIVVDSLSTLIEDWGMNAAYELVTTGTQQIIDAGGSILYLLYSGLHNPLEEARMMRAADVFIILRQNIHGNEFERTLAIEKLKGANVPQRVIPYHITAKGLELSTTSRVV